MVHVRVDNHLVLEIVTPPDSKEIFDLVEKNRCYLEKYMSWVEESKNVNDILEFTKKSCEQIKTMDGLNYKILLDGSIVGIIGFFSNNKKTKTFEIGYWIDEEHSGRGTISRLIPSVEKICLDKFNAGKLEIRCATENIGSNRVALKNNYLLEGTIRSCEKIKGKYLDYNIYGKL